jgi:ribosomal protein S18 acetylase RimI-like enzyme
MNFIIREAAADDRERIRPLQAEIARLHFEGRSDIFKQEARYYTDESFSAKLNNPEEYIYIAENEDGGVIGYAFAKLIRHRGHPTYRDFNMFYIDDICVLKKYRKQGIGKALFARCRNQALADDCFNMDLGVYSFNKNAIAFYEAMGMRPRTMHMELKLQGPPEITA